jgi:hemoglobin
VIGFGRWKYSTATSELIPELDLTRFIGGGGPMIDDLYDLIGRRTIWAATKSFYDKVSADESLRHFFEGTDMAHLRARQSMFLSMLLGGRVVYTGKEIHGAHAAARNHGLNDAHFDTFLKHFRAALEEVRVKSERAEKVIKLLEGKRNAVLNT